MSHGEPKLLEDQVAVHLGVHTTQGSPPSALENESLLALVHLALPIDGKGSSFVSDAPQG